MICILLLLILAGCQATPRIIGGHYAFAAQFPYAAAIYVKTTSNTFFCGGTLYSRLWIITSGQCVQNALQFTIHLGAIDLLHDDANRLNLESSQYVLHPDFNRSTLDNDIGLIRLRMEIQLSTYIKPISGLPTGMLPDESYLRVIGWGQITDNNSALSTQLKYAYVTTLSNQACRVTYGSQITDNMVCIEGNYNEGICHGDTGGALLEIYGANEAVIVGIASFISSNGCESTDPSGFMRVAPYADWVRNVTQS